MIRCLVMVLAGCGLGLYGAAGLAQTPSQTIDQFGNTLRDAKTAQARIDRIKSEQQTLRNQMRIIERDGTTYALRNNELDLALSTLRNTLNDLAEDLQAINETQTGITSLLVGMTDALERFVDLDLPFRIDKRRAVISRLRSQLYRSRPSVAELYQSVVSAYLDEIRYGHTNEVLTENIATPVGIRAVQILRLGRSGLWYVTPDGHTAGRWDSDSRAWVSDHYTDAAEVRAGIALVREQIAPTVIRLPVNVALP